MLKKRTTLKYESMAFLRAALTNIEIGVQSILWVAQSLIIRI